jgi:hypothetical protein
MHWTLIQRVTALYNSLLHKHTSVHIHIFTSCCSVAVSNGGRSPSSRFLNYPRPQLPTSLSNSSQQLNPSVYLTESESESYVTTDGQSASLSLNKAPFWGLRPDIYYSLKVAGLLLWGALSDERTGLSFTIAAGPRQRSHFRVRVP